MSRALYIRTVKAGRYEKVVRYTRTLPGDGKATRAAKQAATKAAQKFINIKNATEKLELLLAANFDSNKACFCTFTFRGDCLPANQKHTQRIFAAYLRKLRAAPERKGRLLKYIYTVEGEPLDLYPAASVAGKDKQWGKWETAPWNERERWELLGSKAQDEAQDEETRLHVHCFLLLEKQDYEAVRALWPYGYVYINQMKVDEGSSFQRLASYVTKEKRNDKKGNGARAYIPSRDLEQPVVNGHWCEEHEGIVLPHGAEQLRAGAERDDIYGGFMEYLFYRLPRQQQPPEPYKSRGSIDRFAP